MPGDAKARPATKPTGTPAIEDLDPDGLGRELMDLVGSLGTGPDMAGTAYDTAWVARLDRELPGRAPAQALEWLRAHQHKEGSWGAETFHCHDRIISTLAAVVTLRLAGDERTDRERIARGCAFLGSVGVDSEPGERETIAFPWLHASLAAEAEVLGLPLRAGSIDHKTLAQLRALGRDPYILKTSPLLFSLEAVQRWTDRPLDLTALRSPNGSVGASPAATAALVGHQNADGEPSLRYLEELVAAQADGSVPDVAPIDVFETAWVLTILRRAGVANPTQVGVRRAIHLLARAWSDDRGVAFSSQFPIADVDDTAFALALLRWGGYNADPAVLDRFATVDRFVTYPGEANPSVSVNVHVVEGLAAIDHPQTATWRAKALQLIRSCTDGSAWADKWHASPYYAAGDAVHALSSHAPDLVGACVRFIEATQRPDGSWGHGPCSTPEETAYALSALVAARQSGMQIRQEALDSAASWLAPHAFDRQFTPLWIGKCLYTPVRVVRAAVQSALYVYLVDRRS